MDKVADDLRNGLISPEKAQSDYGVVCASPIGRRHHALGRRREHARAADAPISRLIRDAGHDDRLGIDVGGTFTDFLLVRDDGSFSTYKTFTSTPDQSIGIMEGLAKFAADEGAPLRGFLGNVDLILHGTTATTNSVLTGSGARTGLLTTKGFRDALEMRRGVKERIYDNKYPAPLPLVPRYRRLPITERVASMGCWWRRLIPRACAQLARFSAATG